MNKMTLISNDCTASYAMSMKNEPFSHPFIWTSIRFNDLMRLNIEFDDINFRNISVRKIFNDTKVSEQNYWCPVITIDGKIDVYYLHHFEDTGEASIDTEDGNKDVRYVKCKDIDKYVTELYNRRLERMKGEPVFIFDDTDLTWYEDGIDVSLLDKLKYPLYIYTERVGYLGEHEKVTYVKRNCKKSIYIDYIREGGYELYNNVFKDMML